MCTFCSFLSNAKDIRLFFPFIAHLLLSYVITTYLYVVHKTSIVIYNKKLKSCYLFKKNKTKQNIK